MPNAVIPKRQLRAFISVVETDWSLPESGRRSYWARMATVQKQVLSVCVRLLQRLTSFRCARVSPGPALGPPMLGFLWMMWPNLCCILMTDHRNKGRHELTLPSSAEEFFRRYTEPWFRISRLPPWQIVMPRRLRQCLASSIETPCHPPHAAHDHSETAGQCHLGILTAMPHGHVHGACLQPASFHHARHHRLDGFIMQPSHHGIPGLKDMADPAHFVGTQPLSLRG